MKNTNNYFIKNTSGFTLIELLLYIGLITIIMSAIIPFAWTIVRNGTASSVHQEIFYAGRYISEKIKYEIRNASGINNVSTTSINLANTNINNNPTVIELSGDNITIKKGSASAVNLNPNGTIISDLVFTNNSLIDNKTKNIGFTITIKSSYQGQRQEYQGNISIKSAAEIRSN